MMKKLLAVITTLTLLLVPVIPAMAAETVPVSVQTLDNALGITIVSDGNGGGWNYSPDAAWEKQNPNESFVTAGVDTRSGDINIAIEPAKGTDPAAITPDLSPLQKALNALFPGADTSQEMAYAQECAANAQENKGNTRLPNLELTIGNRTIFVEQAENIAPCPDSNIFAEFYIPGTNLMQGITLPQDESFTKVASPRSSVEIAAGLPYYFINDQVPGVMLRYSNFVWPPSNRLMISAVDLLAALGSNANSLVDDVPVRDIARKLGYQVAWDAANKIAIFYPAGATTVPDDSNVAQYNQTSRPADVLKLQQLFGVTMSGAGDVCPDGSWSYSPIAGFAGDTNSDFLGSIVQNNTSFVTLGYNTGGYGVTVSVNDAGTALADPSTVNWDIYPFREALETFFPGQEAAIDQVTEWFQYKALPHMTKYDGFNDMYFSNFLPPLTTYIDGVEVAASSRCVQHGLNNRS